MGCSITANVCVSLQIVIYFKTKNNCNKITAKGGHYYFNTDFYADKEWKIVSE